MATCEPHHFASCCFLLVKGLCISPQPRIAFAPSSVFARSIPSLQGTAVPAQPH